MELKFADLRGLGFDTTLVLINGRRTIATASSLSFNAFDLNSIPLGAVERIEIVSDSTSAIYGADAIGGVLNIVLRENIPEPRLDIDYGAAAGGGVERHAAFGASGAAAAHGARSCSTTSIAVRCLVASATAGTIRTSDDSAEWIGVRRSRRPATSARLRWTTCPACHRVLQRYPAVSRGYEPDSGGFPADRWATEPGKSLQVSKHLVCTDSQGR